MKSVNTPYLPHISVITFVTGSLLLVYMIIVEDEPGLIPLLLMVSGMSGFIWSRRKGE